MKKEAEILLGFQLFYCACLDLRRILPYNGIRFTENGGETYDRSGSGSHLGW